MWPENLDAWEVWGQMASPVAVQFQLGAWLLEALTPGCGADERVDLVRRLDIIYDALKPADGGQNPTHQRQG